LLKLSFLFIVCIVAAAFAATPVMAYSIGGSPWPTDGPCPGGNCHGQPVTIKYSYANMFNGGLKMFDNTPLPNSLIKGSIEEALHVWTTAVNVNFVEVLNTDPASQLRFRHVYINGHDPAPPADPIAKAQATCLGYGAACEVQYDNSDPWQENGTQSRPDILGATIHEVGHILGLLHTNVQGANMYWIFHRFPQLGAGQLFPDDIAGIQAIYGAGAGSVTPLGVPEPAAAVLAAVALFGALPPRRRRAR
jgi:hypothetical protein